MGALIDGSQFVGLNVGSGPHYADGWCNTDILPAPEGTRDPDVLADIFNYGSVFEAESFTKAYIGHVLEHIPLDSATAAVQHIAATVQSGGVIMVVGPCIERATATGQPEWLLEQIKHHPGREAHPWDHAWTPTEALTLEVVREAGLLNVEAVPVASVTRPQWPNPSVAPWQTAVTGIVP